MLQSFKYRPANLRSWFMGEVWIQKWLWSGGCRHDHFMASTEFFTVFQSLSTLDNPLNLWMQ